MSNQYDCDNCGFSIKDDTNPLDFEMGTDIDVHGEQYEHPKCPVCGEFLVVSVILELKSPQELLEEALKLKDELKEKEKQIQELQQERRKSQYNYCGECKYLTRGGVHDFIKGSSYMCEMHYFFEAYLDDLAEKLPFCTGPNDPRVIQDLADQKAYDEFMKEKMEKMNDGKKPVKYECFPPKKTEND